MKLLDQERSPGTIQDFTGRCLRNWKDTSTSSLHNLLHSPFLTQVPCAAVDQLKLKTSFLPFSFLPVKALHWTVVTSGDRVGGTDDWGAAYQYFRTADGYNVPWVCLYMNPIARRHVLPGWSKNPACPCWRNRQGELGHSLKWLVTGPWQWHVYSFLHFLTQVGEYGCALALRPGMPCSWLFPPAAFAQFAWLAGASIKTAEASKAAGWHAGTSTPVRWRASQLQPTADCRALSQAACIPFRAASQSDPALLPVWFYLSSGKSTTGMVFIFKKKKKKVSVTK